VPPTSVLIEHTPTYTSSAKKYRDIAMRTKEYYDERNMLIIKLHDIMI
jgi:hypothetical protein